MKKVLYISNFEPPYRVPFYNILGKKYELTIVFSQSNEEQNGRDSRWFSLQDKNYRQIYMKGKRLFGGRLCKEIKRYLKDDSYDVIFMDMYGDVTNMYAIHFLNKIHKKFILSVDGMLPRENENIVYKKIKRYLLNSPQWILSSGKSVTKCLEQYGVSSDKIIPYHFTSLTGLDIQSAVKRNDKEELKKKLGICEKRVVLAVGQFIHRKGFDVLMKAAPKLQESVGVYLVGGEATNEYLEMKESLGLKNVHFVGFKTKSELEEYYGVADLFVLPTREDIWGLVINEAMAYGLPVITTDKCVAGLELVVDNENGFVVPTDDANALFDKMSYILSDDDKLGRMGNKSKEIIKEYSIEKMAEEHIQVFEKYISEKNV